MIGLSLASLGGGIALGIGARLAMRLVALESALDPGFTLGGSMEVIAFAGLLGTPLAFLFIRGRRCWSYGRPWFGVTYGLLIFAALAALQPHAARSALAGTPDTPATTAVVFAAVFAAWGLMLEWLAKKRG